MVTLWSKSILFLINKTLGEQVGISDNPFPYLVNPYNLVTFENLLFIIVEFK